jgi:hypothetical protein
MGMGETRSKHETAQRYHTPLYSKNLEAKVLSWDLCLRGRKTLQLIPDNYGEGLDSPDPLEGKDEHGSEMSGYMFLAKEFLSS